MLIGPAASRAEIDAFAARLRAKPERLHRAADARALHVPDLRRRRDRTAPRRPAPVRAARARGPARARRADPRRAARGLARRQFQPGRRDEGHLGPRGLTRLLSRTADGLFWLARYMERAENVARILTAGQRMASLTHSVGSESNEWGSTLAAAGCAAALSREARGDHARRRRRLPRPRRRQPVERALVPRDRASQCARRADGADRRHVGGAQRHLARAAHASRPPAASARATCGCSSG